MTPRHVHPECTGVWAFTVMGTMGVTFITCSVCCAGTPDRAAADRENELGALLQRLTQEGARFLRRPPPGRAK
jgi:hypothetical protein